MAGRTDRAKGRVKESAGALADHKELKDKGPRGSGEGLDQEAGQEAEEKGPVGPLRFAPRSPAPVAAPEVGESALLAARGLTGGRKPPRKPEPPRRMCSSPLPFPAPALDDER